MTQRQYNINDALVDPGRIFGTPENVVSDPRLDRSVKLEILRKWHLDAKSLSTAESEGMSGDGPSMLSRVQQAIDRLTQSKE